MAADPNLVCPDCGSDTFTQKRYCQVQFTVNVTDYGIDDIAQQIVDSGERDESGITCEGCGADYEHDTDELLTREAYEAFLAEDEDAG
jgi:hypothetical protein